LKTLRKENWPFSRELEWYETHQLCRLFLEKVFTNHPESCSFIGALLNCSAFQHGRLWSMWTVKTKLSQSILQI